MILILLLTIGSFIEGSVVLKSKVKLTEESSVCELTYSFPEGASNKTLQYKSVNQEQWKSKSLNQNGKTLLSSLTAHTLYECKLSWEENEVLFTSDPHFFLTFESIQSETADFDHFKVIQSSTEHKNLLPHHLYQTKLSFRYSDKYQMEGKLQGEVFDENNLLVSRFVTDKQHEGIYHLNLLDLSVGWSVNTPYLLKLSDEKNPTRFLKIQLSELDNELSNSIRPEPIFVDCEGGLSSVIQYLSEISGGHAPYELSWTVTDLSMNNLLSGPTKNQLTNNDDVSSITVDLALPYVLTLSVFDACGRFTEFSTVLTCDESHGEDAILFENIGVTPTRSSVNQEINN